MQQYTVLYRIDSIQSPLDPPFGFECWADDADHAQEQCENAYPECGVVWIEQDRAYTEALALYWASV